MLKYDTSDHTDFDARLLRLIGSGIGGPVQLAEQLANLGASGPAPAGHKAVGKRQVDRRLLALRRLGIICYLRSGWSLK